MPGLVKTSGSIAGRPMSNFQDFRPVTAEGFRARVMSGGDEGGTASSRTSAKQIKRLLDNEDVGVDHLCVGDSDDPFTCLFCKGEVTHGFDEMDRYQDPCSPNIDPLDPMEA